MTAVDPAEPSGTSRTGSSRTDLSRTSQDGSEPVEAGGASSTTPAERPRNYGELALSIALLLIGLYLVIDARTITIPGSANTLGPRFFPYLVGGATIVVGAALVIGILRGDRGPEEEGEDIDPNAKTSWRAVGIIALAFLGQALLINVIGWPLSVTLMFGVVAWALGARGIIRPLIAGGITSVIIWLIFVKALGVLLPGGVLLEMATEWW